MIATPTAESTVAALAAAVAIANSPATSGISTDETVAPNETNSEGALTMNAFLQFVLTNSTLIIPFSLILWTIVIAITIRTIRKRADIGENIPTSDDLVQIEAVKDTAAEKYYAYMREEIAREDEITHQRLTWSITFQGFLINALAFLLVFSWDTSQGIFVVRKLALIAVGVIGLAIGLLSLRGILASRNSIRHAKEGWEARNAVWKLYPNKVPQTYGQNKTFHSGTSYTEYIPLLFVWMWGLFLAGYTGSVVFFELKPCATAQSVSACVFELRMKPAAPGVVVDGASSARETEALSN